MYSVEYTTHAIKDMNKLPAEVKIKIFNAIGKIKDDPYSHVKKLKTSAKTPLFSLRVGEYRAIMVIKDQLLLIQVIEVGNRSKIYCFSPK
jgi:mRNA interferase RelE/StbE